MRSPKMEWILLLQRFALDFLGDCGLLTAQKNAQLDKAVFAPFCIVFYLSRSLPGILCHYRRVTFSYNTSNKETVY